MSNPPKKNKKKSKKKSTQKTSKNGSSFLSTRWQDWLTIAVITFIAFSPIIQNDFIIFDDAKLILNNPIIQNADFGSVFTTLLNTPYYKPMVNLTWIIEKSIFGFNPTVFHVNNLLLHILNSILIYLVVLKVSRFWDFLNPIRFQVAFFTALLFGLHPMHVESVAWAVERKDVLYTAFYLTGFLAYIKFTEEKSMKWILLCAGCYLLSMMSKGPGITLLGVLFVYDFLAKRDIKLNLLVEKIPVFLIFFTGVWMYGLVENLGESTLTHAANEELSGGESFQTTTSVSGILLMNFKMFFWFAHTLIPGKLSIAYPRVEIMEYANASKFILPFITLGVIGALWKTLNYNRFFIFLAAFFVITLAPPLVRNDLGTGIFMSDRYMYLPSFAVIMLIIVAILWLGKKYFSSNKNFSLIALSLIGVLYFFSTFSAVKVWKNPETLWTNAIKKYPQISYPYTSRGVYYLENNNPNKALKDLEKSISIINSSAVSDVVWRRAHIGRARVYRKLGKKDEALADLTNMINRYPNFLKAYTNRANLYTDLGLHNKALTDYNYVLQKSPNSLKALVGRGALYGLMNKPNEGIADLNKVTSIDPNYHDAIRAKIIVYYHSGQLELALESCDRFLELVPGHTEVTNNRNAIRNELGR